MQNFQVKLGNNNFKHYYPLPESRPSSNMYGRVQPHQQNPIRLIPDVKFNVGTQRSSFPMQRISHASTQDNIEKQNSNIQQMKLRLDRLIKQTEIMSERKNYSGQKMVSPQLENHSKYIANPSFGGNRVNVSFSPETKIIPSLHQSNAHFSNSFQLKGREQTTNNDHNKIGNVHQQRGQKTNSNLDGQYIRTIKNSGEIKNSVSSDNIKSLSPIMMRHNEQSKLSTNSQYKSCQLEIKKVSNENSSDRNEAHGNSNPNNKAINLKNSQSNNSPIHIISSSRKKKENEEGETPLGVIQWKNKVTELGEKIKKIEDQLQEAREGKEYYRKQLSQEWRNNKKEKEEKDKGIQELKQKHRKQIEEMSRKIKMKQGQILSLISQASELRTALSQNTDEKSNMNFSIFQKENDRLANLLIERDKQILRLSSLSRQKDEEIKQQRNLIQKLKGEIVQLHKNRNQNISTFNEGFDGILKDQLKYINELKEKIETLQQQNNELRYKLVEESRRNEQMVNEIKIVELKQNSALNNMKISTSIQLENKDNIISSLNKKIQTLEDKYRLAVSDIKTKDEFFKNYLVGRAQSVDLKQSLEKCMNLYIERSLASNQYENIRVELEKARNKIQIYERLCQNQNSEP